MEDQPFCPSWVKSYTLFKVFAIYPSMLGWKTDKYYYETDKLPSPRPTQPKKKWLRVAFGHFFPQQITFRGLGVIYCRKQTTRNPTQSNSSQTLYCQDVRRS